MGWGWVSELIKGIANALKVLFGTDQPAKTTVIDIPNDLPKRARADLLDELRRNLGTENRDTGGYTETRPTDADHRE